MWVVMTNTCKQCGNSWNGRKVGVIPIWCPKCHSRYWGDAVRIEKRGRKSRSE